MFHNMSRTYNSYDNTQQALKDESDKVPTSLEGPSGTRKSYRKLPAFASYERSTRMRFFLALYDI